MTRQSPQPKVWLVARVRFYWRKSASAAFIINAELRSCSLHKRAKTLPRKREPLVNFPAGKRVSVYTGELSRMQILHYELHFQ